MTDWETTKIKAGVKERAADLDETYTDVMQAGIDALTSSHTTATDDGVPTLATDKLAETIADRVAQHTGVDEEVLAREVVRQFDYTALADNTADEIEGRLR